MNRKQSPGVSRENRISDDGLQRLDKQLGSGIKVSPQVLAQWIRRYGEPAIKIIKKHGLYKPEMDHYQPGETR